MRVSEVSFKGIYNVNFPETTKKEDVDKVYDKVNKYIQESPYLKPTVKLYNYELFETKPRQKGFRLVTTLDNPWVMTDLFSQISEDLAQQYIAKTKINLTV